MKLTLLGAPGAGKGTQAEILSKKLNIPTISTGNILRAAIKEGTPIGLDAKAYIDKGALVPDDVVIEIVKERLKSGDCANGFILDGMPRTIPQAQALIDQGILFDHVIALEITDEAIMNRMCLRRVCLKCGATYHVTNRPPHKEGICDICGDAVVIRPDDAPETVKTRLNVYHEQTEPLKEFYQKLGLLISVDNMASIDTVASAISRALELAE